MAHVADCPALAVVARCAVGRGQSDADRLGAWVARRLGLCTTADLALRRAWRAIHHRSGVELAGVRPGRLVAVQAAIAQRGGVSSCAVSVGLAITALGTGRAGAGFASVADGANLAVAAGQIVGQWRMQALAKLGDAKIQRTCVAVVAIGQAARRGRSVGVSVWSSLGSDCGGVCWRHLGRNNVCCVVIGYIGRGVG